MVIDSCVHATLHSNCHHQIIYAKFDPKIIYPPLYDRKVWHYIKTATDVFDWESAFNGYHANDQVSVFNSKTLNIVLHFMPNETIGCDNKDPPWINSFIKNLIRAKDNF